ncbi:MAG: tRNA dihydrouridine synthase DusB [Gammaproteobacteria bacterium]|nr:tRNA dihydrouridine synthase DusB [Gammaproteobacteria bacterium]
MKIGSFEFDTPMILAPMAGVTDKPFRLLCRELGADIAVSEMIKANDQLYDSEKTRLRTDHSGEPGPRSVQILGNDPAQMAHAAKLNADQGADIIDINMGCPAKKVCKKAAGSALLAEPTLVGEILDAVVNAVNIPVTLKIRTGTDDDQINAVEIGQIAQAAGVQALAIHGRTRAQKFTGNAEYYTIKAVVEALDIPVLANGDIDTPHKAEQVLAETGCAGLLIGRAAQGNPWIFREIKHYLQTGVTLPAPDNDQLRDVLIRHLQALPGFYGDFKAPLIARKHIGWYASGKPGAQEFRQKINQLNNIDAQIELVCDYLATTWGAAA